MFVILISCLIISNYALNDNYENDMIENVTRHTILNILHSDKQTITSIQIPANKTELMKNGWLKIGKIIGNSYDELELFEELTYNCVQKLNTQNKTLVLELENQLNCYESSKLQNQLNFNITFNLIHFIKYQIHYDCLKDQNIQDFASQKVNQL